jgi:hypothetical protein
MLEENGGFMGLRRKTVISLCALAFLLLGSTAVLAKRGTIGIYAIVDKVAFEPDEASPERIRIWGTFVVPVPMSSGEYKSPQQGYIYFRMMPGTEQAAKQDWRSLKSLAGTGQCIGFGQYWVPNPADLSGNPHHSMEIQVHQDGDTAVPDDYPVPHVRGVIKTGDRRDPDFDSIVAQLKTAAHN